MNDACHRKHVGGLSVFYRLLFDLAPSALSRLCPPPGFCRAQTFTGPNVGERLNMVRRGAGVVPSRRWKLVD